MFGFLETDIREQKKYEMRTQTSVDNTVNDLRYEIKFENRVKDKNNLFIKWNTAFLFLFFFQYLLFLETYYFKILKNLIASAFFSEADTKKRRYTSAKVSKKIMWVVVLCFSVRYKNDQPSNVIWLSTTWLLMFRMEVGNKKALFTKPASKWIDISC